jgi:hypothetical protein
MGAFGLLVKTRCTSGQVDDGPSRGVGIRDPARPHFGERLYPGAIGAASRRDHAAS